MANQDKQSTPARRISDDERFQYIGFEVCPGKPKDLFRNDAEKAELVRKVEAKRAKGDLLRDDCKLLQERVSTKERWYLTAASILIVLSLFFPWYSAFKETVQQSDQAAVTTQKADESGAEVITSARVQKKVQREYETLSGLGGLVAIGSVGGKMFSSGIVLILTAIIMLAYTLLCLWLPFRALMGLWKSKKTGDDLALHLKYLLRLNWVPVILLVVAFVFSFLGADYGFSAGTYASLGSSYGPGVFLGTATWGLLISLAGFIVLATKGIEI